MRNLPLDVSCNVQEPTGTFSNSFVCRRSSDKMDDDDDDEDDDKETLIGIDDLSMFVEKFLITTFQ
jgi:hypothetical protein